MRQDEIDRARICRRDLSIPEELKRVSTLARRAIKGRYDQKLWNRMS
jgi:hypothetical protein